MLILSGSVIDESIGFVDMNWHLPNEVDASVQAMRLPLSRVSNLMAL